MKAFRALLTLLLLGVSMAATAQLPSPQFDELERKLQIRPEQKAQFDTAVGATKRALLSVGLSFMEMKQRLAEELLKPDPDFSKFLDGADRVFDQQKPLFEEASREWSRLYGQLDRKQIEIAKQFLFDNLGAIWAKPLIEEPKKKKERKKDKLPSEEWI